MKQVGEHVYTPSELNREVKLHLETGFPRVLLEAEISNLARPASGHLYFSLKDNKAQIRCAMFRSAANRTRVAVENGMQVLARGRISLYEPRGDYQFIVDGLEDAGEGLLQRQFEELKKRLEAEGLFDPAAKQPIHTYPSRIGIITSASGAAVRDLLHVLERRWPVAAVRIYPVPVQGVEAPAKIHSAILAANRQAWADTLIVSRGGGSLEDLAAFNDETVARGIFASAIPVISAVGHETDFSIADFVADLRAPTPSAAAEMATPDATVLKAGFTKLQRQITARMEARLQQESQKLDHIVHRLHQRHPASELARQAEHLRSQQGILKRGAERYLADQSRQIETLASRLIAFRPDHVVSAFSKRLDAIRKSLQQVSLSSLNQRQEQLAGLARTLQAVSPLETIGRGYSIITRGDSGEVVYATDQVKPGDRVLARVSDGQLDCTVDKIT
ncbi:MAG: exodeoxyribonuclease VII large subunit [Xanthomonadales bacterium]|nr:exodeoxyribonuclease VII large subunit [Xanthomonadales bacterium]MDH4002728.1 exodeoxyribonuclease VII large subunit [Xanthomonadales bacterium]